jgi:large conductance mechanosensitive channel
VAVRYGLFINTLIDFLIVAFTIFMVLRTINRLAQMRPPFVGGQPAPKQA